MVPQIEKNVAQRASCKCTRSEEFTAACTEMQAPAAAAITIQNIVMHGFNPARDKNEKTFNFTGNARLAAPGYASDLVTGAG